MVLLGFLVACNGDIEDTGFSENPQEALDQINHYRDLMEIELASLNPLLNDAAQAHADYMLTNNTLTHYEAQGDPGFTGVAVWDRVEAAGYNWTGGIMETVAWGTDAKGAVDVWVDSVYHRIPYMMPEWTAGGFGLAGEYTAMAIVHPYPASTNFVVSYPVDGQTDVPTSFDSNTESPDPAPGLSIVGYPIMVAIGSKTPGMSSSNPYEITLTSTSLITSGEEVAHMVLSPENDEYMTYAVCILPNSPLKPNTEYNASFDISWRGGSEMVSIVFTTSP